MTAKQVTARRVRELAFRALFQLDAAAWAGDPADALAGPTDSDQPDPLTADPDLRRLRDALISGVDDPAPPPPLSSDPGPAPDRTDADDDDAPTPDVTARDQAEADRALRDALRAWAVRRDADRAIAQLAPTWPPQRQPAADRALLRLGWWELHHANVKPNIAVNEAVELAKRYSTERSPAFINGVLDASVQRAGDDAAGNPNTDAHADDDDTPAPPTSADAMAPTTQPTRND